MDSIRLSPRLQMVADFVPPCACAADIGTDHGYLPVWLLQNGVVQTAIAADIHVGPLANARKSAAAYDLEERVRFVQADGLQFPDAQAADVITIAGMGGETICAILAATPWLRQGKRLVLQPQSKVQELTDWLWHNGFTIEDAALCRDAGKRYLALRVLGQPAGQTYTVERLLLRRRDPLLPEQPSCQTVTLPSSFALITRPPLEILNVAANAGADRAAIILRATAEAAIRLRIRFLRMISTSHFFVVFRSFIFPPPPIRLTRVFVNNLFGDFLSHLTKKAAVPHVSCSTAVDFSIYSVFYAAGVWR